MQTEHQIEHEDRREEMEDQSGRSMIEMLGVLAIVGMLTVGGIMGYSSATSKLQLNNTTESIQMLTSNIRELFSAQPDYAGLDTTATAGAGVIEETVLINAGAVPDSLINAAATGFENAWGGGIDVVQAGTNNVDFTVTIGAIPEEACTKLAVYPWGRSSASGFLAVDAGPTGSETNWDWPGTTNALPVDVAGAASACNAAANGNTVILTFH